MERVTDRKARLPREVRRLSPEWAVIFGILTDGADNASKMNHSPAVLNALMREFKAFGGTAMFLGANQDAIGVGSQFGFNAGNCIEFGADEVKCKAALGAFSNSVLRTCSGESGEFTGLERTSSAPEHHGHVASYQSHLPSISDDEDLDQGFGGSAGGGDVLQRSNAVPYSGLSRC